MASFHCSKNLAKNYGRKRCAGIQDFVCAKYKAPVDVLEKLGSECLLKNGVVDLALDLTNKDVEICADEFVHMKSDMPMLNENDPKGNESNVDQSLGFEMPECVVEIKLEEGQFTSSVQDDGASSVAYEDNLNVIKYGEINCNAPVMPFHQDYGGDAEGRNGFVCYHCGILITNQDLVSHIQEFHRDGNYTCEFCNERFEFLFQLNYHIRSQHPKFIYSCNFCKEKFNLFHELHLHIRLKHSTESYFRCSFCDKRFRSLVHLKYHLPMHKTQTDMALTPKPQKPKYSTCLCSLCNKLFDSEHQAKTHLSDHLKNEKFTCKVCKEEFTGNVALQKHSIDHIKRDDSLMCRVCNKLFTKNLTLEKHLSKHCKGH